MRTKGNKLTGMVIVALLALFIGLVLAIQIRTTAGGITDTAKVYMQSQQSKVRSQMQAYEAEMRARNQ